jgi:hypothetical protein
MGVKPILGELAIHCGHARASYSLAIQRRSNSRKPLNDLNERPVVNHSLTGACNDLKAATSQLDSLLLHTLRP